MASNKIFSGIVNETNKNSSSLKKDRVDILSKEIAKEFNTYRNWNTIEIPVSNIPKVESSGNNNKVDYDTINGYMTKPLFNHSMGIYGSNSNGDNDAPIRKLLNIPRLDSKDTRRLIRENTDCSIKALVKASEEGKMGRAIYQYSDFMFCKYLNRVPNNYLITLRRFPYPCGDHIDYISPTDKNEKKLQAHLPDLGRLITWMGTPGNEMSNILKYNYKLRWEDLQAKVEDQQGPGDQGGFMGTLFNMTSNPQYLKQVQAGTAGTSMGSITPKWLGGEGMGSPTYQGAEWLRAEYDNNRVYGPIDVVDSVKMRKRGIDFTQQIQLTFDFELRSYDGINTRAAMLDLLANILVVTFVNGKFWGGERRMYGSSQSNLYANLPFYKALGNGQITSFNALKDSSMDTISAIGKSFGDTYFKDGFSLKNLGNMLSSIGGNMMGAILGGFANKLGRPQKMAWSSLLSPAPVGMWHLTIGNPRNPIMTIGNLCMTDANIEHYGPLGLDDFPTGLKVTVTLEHGKPRDAGDIERMYLKGDYRIYTPLGGRLKDLYEGSQKVKSFKDGNDNTVDGDDSIFQKNTEAKSPGTVSQTQMNNNEVYMKFFGTTSTKAISIVGKEAMYGSNPPKPKASTSTSAAKQA